VIKIILSLVMFSCYSRSFKLKKAKVRGKSIAQKVANKENITIDKGDAKEQRAKVVEAIALGSGFDKIHPTNRSAVTLLEEIAEAQKSILTNEAGEKGELFKDGVPTELVGKVFYILGEPGLEIDSSDIDETMKTKIAAHHLVATQISEGIYRLNARSVSRAEDFNVINNILTLQLTQALKINGEGKRIWGDIVSAGADLQAYTYARTPVPHRDEIVKAPTWFQIITTKDEDMFKDFIKSTKIDPDLDIEVFQRVGAEYKKTESRTARDFLEELKETFHETFAGLDRRVIPDTLLTIVKNIEIILEINN